MWTTPEKHTKKRETLRNANQNKTTRRAGYKKVYGKNNNTQSKYSELKEPLFTIVCEITLPQADMWTTPENHTKKRETLGNVNQNKTTRRAGYKVSNPPTPTTKHSELKEPYEMLTKQKH